MSRANKPEKVLRVALKRVQERWTKSSWSTKGPDGKYYLCLEGAITGGCRYPITKSQEKARKVVQDVVRERHGANSIPVFNDGCDTTKDEVLEVLKLALIRLECGDSEDLCADNEEVESLLDKDPAS